MLGGGGYEASASTDGCGAEGLRGKRDDAGVGANSREADGLRGKLNGAGASADSREAGGLRGMKHRACTRADDRGAERRGGKRNSVRADSWKAVRWGGDVDSACVEGRGHSDRHFRVEWRGRQSRGGKVRRQEHRSGCYSVYKGRNGRRK